MSGQNFIKLEVYVPETHAEKLKSALFTAGAGRLGNYDCCCWQTSGTGQFRPLEGNEAFIGENGEVSQVDEIKLEILCPEDKKEEITAALIANHPYETPAFYYTKIQID
jgi:hypothetical protein